MFFSIGLWIEFVRNGDMDMQDEIEKAILIANGFDIQVAGDDYLNKWIIVRMLAKAKMNKYDCLFLNTETQEPIITGDEIIEMFNNMIDVANEIRADQYDEIIERYNSGSDEIKEAVKDFKKNYDYELKSVEQIGMEDWILIFLLYLIKEKDILNQYGAIKKGFVCMILDAIYCEGTIQNIYQKLGMKLKKYFRRFDKIFTLNYDNSMEKINMESVFHLHGEYESEGQDEESYCLLSATMKDENILYQYPEEMQHCNCSAILDFCGNRKYQYASEVTVIKEKTGKGYDYHFKEFENLAGQLTIVGLATNNDKHIFECINRSRVSDIVYYYFGNEDEEKNIVLPVNKTYVIRNVKELWHDLNVKKQHNSTTSNSIIRKDKTEVNKFLDIFNSFYGNKVMIGQVVKELQSIPVVTEKVICDMMESELDQEKYHETPKDEKDLFQKFIDFGNVLKISSVSPQTFFFLNMIKMKK